MFKNLSSTSVEENQRIHFVIWRVQVKNDQCLISIYMDIGSFYFCLCEHRWFFHLYTQTFGHQKGTEEKPFPKFVHSTFSTPHSELSSLIFEKMDIGRSFPVPFITKRKIMHRYLNLSSLSSPISIINRTVSYTHLTLPTIYSV